MQFCDRFGGREWSDVWPRGKIRFHKFHEMNRITISNPSPARLVFYSLYVFHSHFGQIPQASEAFLGQRIQVIEVKMPVTGRMFA